MFSENLWPSNVQEHASGIQDLSQGLHWEPIQRHSRPVQDYIPRHFAFSFGFYCKDRSRKSLKGLKYNIIIYSQSNATTCSTMPKDLTYCSNYYTQVSFPNLIDHQNMKDAAKLFHILFSYEFILDDVYNCYPYFMKAMCYVFFPRCNATSNSFIVSYKEVWKDLSEACFAGPQSASIVSNLLPSLFSTNKHIAVGYNLPSFYISSTTFDYTYLPSKPIQCYYEKVICESPPNITGAKIEMLHANGTYFGGDTVIYSCTDDSKEIYVNSTVRCLYSGMWSNPPVCRNRDSNTNLLKILLPTFILLWCLILVVIIVYIHRRRRRNTVRNVVLRRRREFDAYVCYDFDENNDYAMGTLLPEFEGI